MLEKRDRLADEARREEEYQAERLADEAARRQRERDRLANEARREEEDRTERLADEAREREDFSRRRDIIKAKLEVLNSLDNNSSRKSDSVEPSVTEVSAEDKTATFVQNTDFNRPPAGSEPQLEQITNDLLNMPLYTHDLPRDSTSKLPVKSSTQVVIPPNIPQQPEFNSDRYFINEHTRNTMPSYTGEWGKTVNKTTESVPISQWGRTTHTRSGAPGISEQYWQVRQFAEAANDPRLYESNSPGFRSNVRGTNLVPTVSPDLPIRTASTAEEPPIRSLTAEDPPTRSSLRASAGVGGAQRVLRIKSTMPQTKFDDLRVRFTPTSPVRHANRSAQTTSSPIHDNSQTPNREPYPKESSPNFPHPKENLDLRIREVEIGTTSSGPDTERILETMCTQMAQTRIPVSEPDKLDGKDPLSFPLWRIAFDSLVSIRAMTATDKLNLLNKYLAGEAKSAIRGYLMLSPDRAFTKSYGLLMRRYGDKSQLANDFLTQLRNWPKINGTDNVGLRRYVDFLHQCKTTMDDNRAMRVLDDESENMSMLKKLPMWLARKWSRNVATYREEHGEYPAFSYYVEFVTREDRIAHDLVSKIL